MFPFTIFRRSANDIATIKAQDAVIEELQNEVARLACEVAKLERYKRKHDRRKMLNDERKKNEQGIKNFIRYKNWRTESRDRWPKVVCEECSNHVKTKTHRRCSLHHFNVGRFSSCINAVPRRINLEERRSA